MIDRAKRALSALGFTAFSLAVIIGFGSGQTIGICASGSDHHQAAGIDLRVPEKNGLDRAVFAGGCFWGTQYSFQKLAGISLTGAAGAAKGGRLKEKTGESSGIVSTTVGYIGGHFKDPTYRDVCSERTGHAEAVLVVYDAKKISYRRLVEYFFTIHDPTTRDSQGPDFGSQYRSAIFYTSPKQKEVAQSVIADLFKAHKFSAPVVTQIAPAEVFYPAEEYHQSYDLKKGTESCAVPLGR